MAAFAAITKRINIGSIHLANNFRHPALVAKYFSTLSHISNGRIILFYDYAWRESEFRQVGISFEKKNKRVIKMIEGLNIIKKSFKEKKINFSGEYYKIKNFICNPKPLKKIPIWLGETDNQFMVKEIVKNADVFNSMPCSLNVFKKKLEIIKKECKKQNKAFNKIGKSLETQILIAKNDKDLKKKITNIKKNRIYNKTFDNDIIDRLKQLNKSNINYDNLKTLKEEFFIGTVEEIRQKIKQFSNIGVNHFMFWPMDFPENYTLEKLINKII
jgi:alkanesulfonate monooxygenase SsuD/methylene tetrahydromethanopterin reductase-like flavin-dependent oxidoreductase (luciferase family)